MIEIVLTSPWWAQVATGVWLWSVLIGVFVLAKSYRRMNVVSELILATFAQWWIVISVLEHKGFAHGWTIHMVNERLIIGVGVLGLANLFMYRRSLR